MPDDQTQSSTTPLILIDDPAPGVRRITINRPEKRNALNHEVRGGLIDALRRADMDDSISCMIVRGAGTSFSAGYDLGGGNSGYTSPDGWEQPWFTAGGDG